ncbi:MAG: hypothetical protein KGH72_02070 [Candidatus Micrarchaeota archaeon]|nr:hypothetical protein [Candidatus Micrarchaeota archaeon]
MEDPFSLKAYVVQRKMGLGIKLTFTGPDGQQVLKSEGSMLITSQPLQTMDGKTISTITHKIIAATPEYDIHEGGPKDEITGVVKVPYQLMTGFDTLREIDIKDASGNAIAKASGNFMHMEFDISDREGKAVAKVTRKLDAAGFLGKLTQLETGQYLMQITGDSVPTKTLIEFLIVLELLLAKGEGSNPGLIGGGPLTGMGMPGSGGGGIEL